MKKIISFLMIFMLFFNLIIPIKSNAEEIVNLFKDESFEMGTKYWNKYSSTNLENIEISNEDSKTGLSSVRFSNSTSKVLTDSISQLINLNSSDNVDKCITVSYYIKTNNFSSGELQLKCTYYNSNNEVVDTVYNNQFIKENSSWYKKTATIKIPNNEDITKVRFSFACYNYVGKLYIDDVFGQISEDVEANSILRNGNFENDLEGWSKTSLGENLKVELNDEIAKQGNNSMKFSNMSNEDITGSIVQNINISDNAEKTLKISQWIKSENFSGNFQVRGVFFNKCGEKINSELFSLLNVEKDSDWSLKSSIFDIPPDAKSMKLTIYYRGTGTVYIDDVKVEIIEKENTLIKNGGFEYEFQNWSKHSDISLDNITINKNEFYEGSKSIQFTNSQKGNFTDSIYQKININETDNKIIKVNQYVKSIDFQGDFKIKVTYYDIEDNVIDTIYSNINIAKDSDWLLKESVINIPNNQNIKTARISLLLYNYEGTLLIDNVKAEINEDYEANKILKNGDFENDISYWNFTSVSGNDLKIEIDNNIKESKGASLKVYNLSSEMAKGNLNQKINIEDKYRGKILKISQWTKSKNLKGEDLRLAIRFFNKNDEMIDEQTKYLGANNCSEWNKQEFNIDILDNSEISYITINYLFLGISGEFWIDDIEISEVENNENVDIATNGGFEANINNLKGSWSFSSTDNNKSYIVDSENSYEGNNSLKVTIKSIDAEAEVNNYSNISPNYLGKFIKVSENIKANTTAKINMTINYLDKNNIVLKTSKSIFNVNKSEEWDNYYSNFEIPKNESIEKITVQYEITEAKGEIWIDNLKIEPYTSISTIKNSETVLLLKEQESKNISILTTPSNATHKNFLFKSEDESIVQINKEGKVTAVKKGISNIIVTEAFDESILYKIPVVVEGDDLFDINNVTLEGKQGECLTGVITSYDSKIKYSILNDGRQGHLYLDSDGTFKYYINKDSSEYDDFSIKAEDSNGNIDVCVYSINITSKSELPSTKNLSIVLDENTSISGSLKKDIFENIKYTIETMPKNGMFTLNENGEYNYIANKGFIGYDNIYVKLTNEEGKFSIVKCMIYVAPSKLTIKNCVLNVLKPSALLTNDDFDRIKENIKNDKTAEEYYKRLKRKIDVELEEEPFSFVMNGKRLSAESKGPTILDFSFMYKLTGDTKYAERAAKELDIICDYPTWNEAHQLDMCEISVNVSLGYEWLSDYLSNEQKIKIKNAMLEKSFNKELELSKNSRWFDENRSNWGIVCYSSLILSGLAMTDKDNIDVTTTIVNNSLKELNKVLNIYFEDGSSGEGPFYWRYSIENLMFSYSAIKNILGTSEPFSGCIDLEEIGEYSFYLQGNQSQFNYADSEKDEDLEGYLNEWIGYVTNNPKYVQYNKWIFKKGKYVNIYSLMWFKTDLFNSQDKNLDLDKYFSGDEIVSMRFGFDQEDNYIAFKGGYNGEQHGDLDVGSFVFDSLGERWAVDLGKENYDNNNINVSEKGSRRWKYYRKRAEGHNTLVIGTSINEDQVVDSTSKIIEQSLNKENPYAILDMTPAYSDKAVDVKRKIQMVDERKNISIEDSFILNKEENVTWQMHTEGEIEIINNNVAIITKNNKKIVAVLSSDCNAKFEVKDAKPTETSPIVESQVENEGVKKLVATTKTKQGNIKVVMGSNVEIPKVEELKIIGFTADKESPQQVNTTIKITTTVSGGTGQAQYKYYRYFNGIYEEIKNWSTENSVEMTSNKAGEYDIYVAVKDETGKIVRKKLKFEFKNVLEISSFITDKKSPQPVNEVIKLTTKIRGETGKVQYKYYRYFNGIYEEIKNWSTENSVEMTSSKAREYDIYVAVKDETGKIVRKNLKFEFK